MVENEDGVATTAHGRGLSLLDRLILVPSLSRKIKAVNVVEGLSFVVVTSVAAIDVDLSLEKGITHVGSGERGSDG